METERQKQSTQQKLNAIKTLEAMRPKVVSPPPVTDDNGIKK